MIRPDFHHLFIVHVPVLREFSVHTELRFCDPPPNPDDYPHDPEDNASGNQNTENVSCQFPATFARIEERVWIEALGGVCKICEG